MHDPSLFDDGVDFILKVNNPKINNHYFYTDSNGLFEMQRTRNDKWEKMVYPMTSYARIGDSDHKMSVFTDVAKGVVSDRAGNLMVYLERSSSKDDHRGVDENV